MSVKETNVLEHSISETLGLVGKGRFPKQHN